MTLRFQKLARRRRLAAAAAAAAAVTAAGLTYGVTGASAATAPVLQTLTYTATGPGGGLYHPVGVSAANGTVYVSDTGANLVGAIASGATTAFAGSLSAYGEHGDGGPATSASLYHPGGSAVDAKGDLFIADSGDNVIREVTPAGTIRRIAGHRHRRPRLHRAARLPRRPQQPRPPPERGRERLGRCVRRRHLQQPGGEGNPAGAGRDRRRRRRRPGTPATAGWPRSPS